MKVYLIRMDTGTEYQYKIGRTTKKVKDRISELQVGNPYPIIEIFEYESDFAVKMESILHRAYNGFKTKGEWFYLGKGEVATFLEKCEMIHGNLVDLKKMNNPFI